MISFTLFQASTLITALVSLSLGIFVYFSGQKTKLNFSWLLTSIAISLWSLGLFGVVFSNDEKVAWFWQYILDIGGICVPVLYFNFLLHLLKKEKGLIILQSLCFASGVALIIMNFTDFFKTGISPKFGINFWIDPGKLYVLFPLYFIILVVISMVVVIRGYRLAVDGDYKRQLLYVLWAQIFGFGGGITDFFPQVFNIYPFGNYFVILYVIFISYAALKHHLFDVKVIATELLIFTISVFLFVKLLLSSGYKDLMLNGGIFIAVAVAGVLLIKSVLREVRQREKIEEIEKELEKAYAVEKRANAELQNLDKVKNQFISQVQHDLRTPLGIFSGYCDVLLNGNYGKLPKKSIEVVKRIQNLAQSKLREVNTFLDVTQFQLGKGALSLKPGVDASLVLEEVFNEMKPQAEAKGLYLNFKNSDGTFEISADREKLKAAIFNIVDNCIKYTKEGGVDISIERNSKPGILITIKDTGIGIDPERAKTLFETQFERSEQAQRMSVIGKGIGLYLSGQIIKAHNGKVWAESKGEGMGTGFFIELPAK